VDLDTDLATYVPQDGGEAADVARVRTLVAGGDPFRRSAPLHVTGSALVLHPPTGRVLLRWHERMGSWLHLGGHVDPGEAGPAIAARREAEEESGLHDLTWWPDPDAPVVLQVVIVPVPEGSGEPAHEHADVRYVLATSTPDAVVAERQTAPVRWASVDEARDLVTEGNLRVALGRLAALRAARLRGHHSRSHPHVEVEHPL
jgi:8-oxo-dGTP pyrophosphatase MutT (NUDIX family)